MNRLLAPALAYTAVGLALWPLPVVGMLHAEGAAVMAAASFFVAGLSTLGARGRAASGEVRDHLLLLAVPLAMLSATLLWRDNCGLLLGLGLFLLLVPPSTILGLGVGRVVATWTVRYRWLWFVGIGILLAVVPTVLTLKLRPQLFVYNLIYGGVLGPIYDSELAIRPGLFVHRALTLTIGIALLSFARWRETRRGGIWPLALCAVIAIAYAFSTPLGFTQSEASLQRHLSTSGHSAGAVLHYAPGSITEARAASLLDDLDYHMSRLARQLGAAPEATVHVYLYPDAETKAALIGSRETSVVPVWLPTPQVHLLEERADGDLAHELVHVFAREFGGALTGATARIGLVEGLAVALEAPEGLPSPEQQVAASRVLPPEAGGLADPAAAIGGAMDPFGFWTGRAGVAYSVSGAWVRWLLDRYGPEPVRAAYGGADWAEAFGSPLATLAADWATHLETVEVTPEAEAYTAWRFDQPSLFEVACPHHIPAWRLALRKGDEAWDDGDLQGALHAYRQAATEPLADSSWFSSIQMRGERARMLVESPLASADRLVSLIAADTLDLWELRLMRARALRLSGDESATYWNEAIDLMPPYAARLRALTSLESDLGPDDLRRVLLPRADSAAAVQVAQDLSSGTPEAELFRALLYAEAGDPQNAWRAAAPHLDSLASGAEREGVVELIGVRLAYAAGEWEDAKRLVQNARTVFGRQRREGLVAVAEDWKNRLSWRRTRTR